MQATNACTPEHTRAEADAAQAGTDGGQHSPLYLHLECRSGLSLSLSLLHTPSLMGAEKLQLIKDANGGGEWLLILH